MATREGYCYRPKQGLEIGLKCSAVITPHRNIPSQVADVFDIIVLGAGYAGLTACRDLCVAGYKVLMVEARDRVGGRTYTANVDGHLYEMGGTWVHWNQPHTYREMSRYGAIDMTDTHDSNGVGCNKFTACNQGISRDMSTDEAGSAVDKAFEVFCNVDGKGGRIILPFPHNPHFNPDAKRWEKISVSERLEQVKGLLNQVELGILKASIAAITGNIMEASGFFDILRWWALSGYTSTGLYEATETFKLRLGQSDFARRFFDEALETRKLSYAFGVHVSSVSDHGSVTIIKSRSGESWAGRRLVCTAPLNVLPEIRFEPPLPAAKLSAARQGQINVGAKVHMEIGGTDLRSWACTSWPPTRVLSAVGDGITPAGNTHVVFFGLNKDTSTPEEDARDFVADAKRIHDMNVEQVVWHNWAADPLSRGTWCMFPPDFSFTCLEALREKHGNVRFASGDWALGWRGFIDGAIEEGARAAKLIMGELGYPGRPVAFL